MVVLCMEKNKANQKEKKIQPQNSFPMEKNTVFSGLW